MQPYLYKKYCRNCSAYFVTPKYQQELCPECFREHQRSIDQRMRELGSPYV